GSAATRARTRASNAGEGSIIGSSSSKPDTARNSFTRRRQIAHASRCVSTSRASLAFSRPSTYPRILFSIRSQLITTFLHSQFPLTVLRPITESINNNLAFSLPLYFITSLLRSTGDQRRQLHPQRLIRPEQQRFQRTLLTFQNLRDLVVVQLLILVQQHRGPLLLRQFLDGVPDHLLPILLHQVLLDVRMLVRCIDCLLIPVLSICRNRRIQRNLRPLMPRVPHRIQRQVRRDPEQPGRELCARHVIRPRPVHPNENFLRQVFGLLPVPNHPIQEIDKRTPVALE